MDFGQIVTLWTARVSAFVYLMALILLMRHAARRARVLWTIGLIVYLIHVWFAFTYFYDWSHETAYRETARQTASLFGVDWGGGLYLNYLFTLVWSLDCLWWWSKEASYQARNRWVKMSTHAFLAFMFLNATIVVWVLKWR
ncbi:MAG TPA: hypothetical protein VEX68_26845 [Bryobacteraceae bacterium]|nr:hypothetical protein [Bryobacteraceae bacterium]